MKALGKIALFSALLLAFLPACTDDDDAGVAYVQIKNDFNNPEMDFQPPWTICRAAFLDAEVGLLRQGDESDEVEVTPGLGHVLMVAAWDDPSCAPENALPIASRNEEEVVGGQHRTIAINLPNHQGPCPPEGVAPIPEDLYERIRALWPEFAFKPYAERTENAQCLD